MGNEQVITKRNNSNRTLNVDKESISSNTNSARDATSPLSVSTNPDIKNGVINEYISQRLVIIAASFWSECIESLSMDNKLEIGCSIYFGTTSKNKDIKKMMQSRLSTQNKLERQSLKHLDMIGWLMRNLLRENIDLISVLKRLGNIHERMGTKLDHYHIMLHSLHETMSYYFPKEYTIDVQYAMEQIITLSSQIMTQKNCNVKNIQRQKRLKYFRGCNTKFVQSLEQCLTSSLGSEYFYRYLDQNSCEELSVYLKLFQKFKNATCDQQKQKIAVELIKTCILPNSRFAINISYETRKNLLDNFHTLKHKVKVTISNSYFEDVQIEVRRLIIKNHWKKFVNSIVVLHNSMDDVKELQLN